MPGINDAPEQVARIIELADAAGATSIGGQTLFLPGPVRELFFEWLRAKRPDLVERYERLYRRGSRVPVPERRAIEDRAGLHRRARAGSAPRFRRPPPGEDAPSPGPAAPPRPPAGVARPVQGALF
jgi:DNA repair photolyase